MRNKSYKTTFITAFDCQGLISAMKILYRMWFYLSWRLINTRTSTPRYWILIINKSNRKHQPIASTLRADFFRIRYMSCVPFFYCLCLEYVATESGHNTIVISPRYILASVVICKPSRDWLTVRPNRFVQAITNREAVYICWRQECNLRLSLSLTVFGIFM